MTPTNHQHDALSISVVNDANTEFEKFLHEQIRSFNNIYSMPHRQVRKVGLAPLHIIVRGHEDRIVGGIAAFTYWNWLEIDNFWLEEGHRGRGVGRDVLTLAEHEAKSRGCLRASLRTFSFQARGFYEKQGYRIIGTLEDYPPGEAFYWMRKDF
ncbi:MAG: GNAT family N-acetyltransferase [Chloroflexota bacterium]